jgi:hypothetical protein
VAELGKYVPKTVYGQITSDQALALSKLAVSLRSYQSITVLMREKNHWHPMQAAVMTCGTTWQSAWYMLKLMK